MYKDNDYIFDAIATIENALQGKEIETHTNCAPYDLVVEIDNSKFYCYAKKEVRRSQLNILLANLTNERLNHPSRNLLFIGDYIATNIKGELKQSNFNYIDGAGNAFISAKNFYIYIEGKKREPIKNVNQSRAFQESGLKLILVLLSDFNTVNDSYRTLSEKAGIALGSVSQIMKELEENNFLLKTTKGRKIKRKEELIERWVVAYSEIIKPRYFKRSFKFLSKTIDPRNQIAGNQYNIWWGGEAGASIYTEYLVPEDYIIFVNGEINEIARDLKLIPDENGNFKFYQKFWTTSLDNDNMVAPPLVVYADLVSSGYGRNIETAKIILNKYYGI